MRNALPASWADQAIKACGWDWKDVLGGIEECWADAFPSAGTPMLASSACKLRRGEGISEALAVMRTAGLERGVDIMLDSVFKAGVPLDFVVDVPAADGA